ncbi:hypothetical protein GLOTRDRAFT_93502 [Gloeophyllum trabeum ATCC 11539]|uniref:Uncharacterized protein n=1 Tax=Gloeophyllum trabeum (strain ATCC 11539 / FP-39264 / Madison 617) TaxID=670483 RepID=S7Q9I0_GLOTA|nr:uncharacterized protein GLOTRDRAFT_93502 [Gloeophyllum trabeum ATCC 11539]EPQ56003.1 hypothetical protein GLOTRDRAFT_93502 [Gloeophyllum trabeum ATCC 11539]
MPVPPPQGISTPMALFISANLRARGLGFARDRGHGRILVLVLRLASIPRASRMQGWGNNGLAGGSLPLTSTVISVWQQSQSAEGSNDPANGVQPPSIAIAVVQDARYERKGHRSGARLCVAWYAAKGRLLMCGRIRPAAMHGRGESRSAQVEGDRDPRHTTPTADVSRQPRRESHLFKVQKPKAASSRHTQQPLACEEDSEACLTLPSIEIHRD